MKTIAATALLLALGAEAHITLWHKSLFGYNHPGQGDDPKQNYNTNEMVNPLRANDNYTTKQWFAHGALEYHPVSNQFMELEVGKPNRFELACNRAFTAEGNPDDKTPKPPFACPLHNGNEFETPHDKLDISIFGGTALGIAYTSDEKTVKPEDFTIISVNYTSPWYREVDYTIPKDLPPCPDSGCLCTWNWIHGKLNMEGYGDEFYNTLYRCKVTGNTDGNKGNTVNKPQPPVHCEDSPDKCVKGAKQGMFLWMIDGNNVAVPEPGKQNPTYNKRYGFEDGPQNDAIQLRAAPPASSSPAPSSAPPKPSSASPAPSEKVKSNAPFKKMDGPSLAAIGVASVCGVVGMLAV